MAVAFWLSVFVFIVAAAAGLALAAVRALAAWRAVRQLRRRVGDGLLDITGKLERAESGLKDAGETAGRLDRARLELQEALATAAVLRAAAGEAKALVTRARVPRK